MEAEKPEPIESVDNRQFDELHNQKLNDMKTESEKLTLQWCFKYPKAKIRETNVDFVNGFYDYENVKALMDYEFKGTVDLNYCKLILRPLSSLTDEEKRHCKQLRAEYGILNSKGIINEADYLRSINIDIDGLQERGIAVYE